MRFQRVSVVSLGYAMPPHVISSDSIEVRLAPVYERLGLQPGRLELMTGIRARRAFDEGAMPSSVATAAGRAALERVPELRSRIGCVIHASVCRDFLEPASANLVHDALELPKQAAVFDVSNACLGVANGMLIVANMIELGQIDAGLVVSGEIGKPLLDATIESLLADERLTRRSIKGAFASLTIGSGAAAVLLARRDLVPEDRDHRLIGASLLAATQHNALCRGGESGAAVNMNTDAEALLHAGLDLAAENWAAFVEETEFGVPDRVVTHQVGKAHHALLCERLGLLASSAYVSFDRLGNIGSAALPMSLALAVEEGFVARGHRVALLGIGSGLSSIMLAVKW
ncbi:MAG: 3-oxoacyl-ACP synthase III [Deltaproteobacteria bacterium]|nr:3-oxoacyl-ACP synthase III [Deltaproteobacteria bacterium]